MAQAGAATAGAAGLQSTCARKAPAAVATTGRVELPIQFVVNQAPMTIGAPAAGRTGLEYKLSALELFLAEPTLLDANGHELKAQIVGPDAKPLPYGIQLVNADDPATETLRLSVPQGNYTALTFGVGESSACDDATERQLSLGSRDDRNARRARELGPGLRRVCEPAHQNPHHGAGDRCAGGLSGLHDT